MFLHLFFQVSLMASAAPLMSFPATIISAIIQEKFGRKIGVICMSASMVVSKDPGSWIRPGFFLGWSITSSQNARLGGWVKILTRDTQG